VVYAFIIAQKEFRVNLHGKDFKKERPLFAKRGRFGWQAAKRFASYTS
jgi:hypothetical protein